MSSRLERFHGLPGVWDEAAEIHSQIWDQIQRQLARGGPLNESERTTLQELLTRLRKPANSEARRLLRFKVSTKSTSQRNAELADAYVALLSKGKTRVAAVETLARKYGIEEKTLKNTVIDRAAVLGPARSRLLARTLIKSGKTSGVLVFETDAKSTPPKKNPRKFRK